MTPSKIAAVKENVEIAKLLGLAGADINTLLTITERDTKYFRKLILGQSWRCNSNGFDITEYCSYALHRHLVA